MALMLGGGRAVLRAGDCLEILPKLTEPVDLVLIDPPYVGMVNESWDRMTDAEAREFFDAVLKESFRLLRPGGRFLSFASNDTLKYLYGSRIEHRELLVIDKGVAEVSAGRNTRQYRQHVNHCEYVFVGTKNAREYTRGLLLGAANGRSSAEMNKLLGAAGGGGGLWSIYTGDNICGQVPTLEHWQKLRREFPELPWYDEFEEVFFKGLGKGNILSGFDFRMKGRVHPTQKPVELVEYLLRTYTRPGALVLDFVMGSGTSGVGCMRTACRFIGVEKDPGHFSSAAKRIEESALQPPLFA